MLWGYGLKPWSLGFRVLGLGVVWALGFAGVSETMGRTCEDFVMDSCC